PAGVETVVAPSTGGAAASVVWDTTATFGFRNLTARVTIEARDRFGAVGAATIEAPVVNDTPPTATFLSFAVPGMPVRGPVPFAVAVPDPEAALDPPGSGSVDLDGELSTDRGATFAKASLLALGSGVHDAGQPWRGRPAGVFPDVSTGRTSLLWDAAADIG